MMLLGPQNNNMPDKSLVNVLFGLVQGSKGLGPIRTRVASHSSDTGPVHVGLVWECVVFPPKFHENREHLNPEMIRLDLKSLLNLEP